MAAARAATARSPQKVQRELEDLQLVIKARNGDGVAMDALIRRYTGFVRLKASSYFLAGCDNDDLLQEGLIGLYKAVRDFRPDKETSFRSFAELCVMPNRFQRGLYRRRQLFWARLVHVRGDGRCGGFGAGHSDRQCQQV
jgi:DNA-directed RNA polymerase specialized sigma subunit